MSSCAEGEDIAIRPANMVMTDIALLSTFLVTISILTITPGVDTAIVLRAAAESRREAALAAWGIALGCLVWGAIAAIGLGALLRASAFGHMVVKTAGALFLICLGAKLILKPRTETDSARTLATRGGGPSFRRGFLTNMLNPKIGVFYVTFLPQFVPPQSSAAIYMLFLTVIHMALALAWFALLIAATVPLGSIMRQARTVCILDRITGCILVVAGLRLATSSATR